MHEFSEEYYTTGSFAAQTCSFVLGAVLFVASVAAEAAPVPLPDYGFDDTRFSAWTAPSDYWCALGSYSAVESIDMPISRENAERLLEDFAVKLGTGMVDAPPLSGQIIDEFFWELLGGRHERDSRKL